MLTESEIDVLESLSKRLLARKREIAADMEESDGVEIALQSLISMGFVEGLEPIGEKCFVITKKGSVSLRDSKTALNKLDY